jgi:hypothetical protein
MADNAPTELADFLSRTVLQRCRAAGAGKRRRTAVLLQDPAENATGAAKVGYHAAGTPPAQQRAERFARIA